MSRSADALREAIERNAGVDLHSHTIHSDGAWTPEDLLRDAAAAGIHVFAVTDHDTVSGLGAAQAAADRRGMILIPGVEVSVRVEDRPYHVHCYDVDYRDPRWASLAEGRRYRYQRYYDDVFDQIGRQGIPVERSTVLDANGFYVRHPVSTALTAGGFAKDFREAGALLRRLGIRYAWEKLAITPEEYGAIIPADGGVCVVAHPAREERGVSSRLNEADIARLSRHIPLVGLEAYHPYHTASDLDALQSLAAEHDLVVTAGSDAHGFQVSRPPKAHTARSVVGFLELIVDRWQSRERAAA